MRVNFFLVSIIVIIIITIITPSLFKSRHFRFSQAAQEEDQKGFQAPGQQNPLICHVGNQRTLQEARQHPSLGRAAAQGQAVLESASGCH